MIEEHDLVALTTDIKEHGLVAGDVGTVVHCYADGEAYEVEFMTRDGKTIGVLTLEQEQVRALDGQEILHVRAVSDAAA